MKKFKLIGELFTQNKFGVIATYVLFGSEILCHLISPFLLGNAIDDLIKNSYYGILIFSGFYLLRTVVSVFRRILDTKVYTKLYTDLVTRFLSAKTITDANLSKLTAHSGLAKEFINFLEYDLANLMYGIFTLIGSILMLFFYSTDVLLICLLVIIPIFLISKYFGKKIIILTKKYNDEYEKQIAVISSGDQNSIRVHYQNLRNLDISKSNQDAFSFGLIELCSLIMVAISLVVLSTNTAVATAGTIVGVYNYVISFSNGLDIIPYVIERYAELNDIATRIEIEAENLD